MVSIKEKLYGLEKTIQVDMLRRTRHVKPSGDDLESVGLREVGNEYGSCLIREKIFRAHLHTAVDLNELVHIQSHEFAFIGKDHQLSILSPDRIVFIDTETTGLAGGTGTYAFIVGVGKWVSDGFRIRQFFMRDHGQEMPFLREIAKEIENASGIVSFNGKCYDIPLLRTRFLMNRMDLNWDRYHHLDLLHTARRLWKPFVDTCRLNEIEQFVLGFKRSDDIPGYLIPGLYFNSIKSGDLGILKPVFQHNAIDITSLAGITIKAANVFRDSMSTVRFDLFGVIRTFEDMGLYDLAKETIKTKELFVREEERSILLIRKAWYHKKLKEFKNAEAIWIDLLGASRFLQEPYLELAKYYEHQQKRPGKALSIVDRAEKRIELLRELKETPEYDLFIENLKIRRARLLRKIERQM